MNRKYTWSPERIAKVGRLVRSLYAAVKELEEEFTDEKRKFTLDGHLVGSIGEVVASYAYELDLYPPSIKGHDAKTADGKEVQVKLTGGKTGVRLNALPEYLIVLQLRDYQFREVYNGPGRQVWDACGAMAKNGQRPIGLSKLVALNMQVQEKERIAQRHPLPDLSQQV
jgi:hypothetical protein